ncbi:MAG: YdcF family protein [Candidatus Sungbacteria bacterium]|nr:YdcF family protein [Candidatus Sungbacteria bacterium]
MHQPLEQADCILALGSNDVRVAERAAELFLKNWALFIIFSGGRGWLTPEEWKDAEADMFKKRALEMGVPEDKILVENKSTNTGENIQFVKELLVSHGLDPQKIILVQKPYMERRAYATFKKVWPEKNFVVTSPQISFEQYPTEKLPIDLIINIMVGDLQRIKIYPKKGFQIVQDIPSDVWDAYDKLVSMGYTDHLVNS